MGGRSARALRPRRPSTCLRWYRSCRRRRLRKPCGREAGQKASEPGSLFSLALADPRLREPSPCLPVAGWCDSLQVNASCAVQIAQVIEGCAVRNASAPSMRNAMRVQKRRGARTSVGSSRRCARRFLAKIDKRRRPRANKFVFGTPHALRVRCLPKNHAILESKKCSWHAFLPRARSHN